MSTEAPATGRDRVRVVVATTVFLSFISFWRAAAIVLGDLGSSAFYVGGIAEQAVGKAAPWFILGVMLFSYAVRAIYIESSVMFVRGGVYRVVKEAMGGTLAKLSVSALLFDYVLTGPISAVSAGQYIVGPGQRRAGARSACALPVSAQRRRRGRRRASIIVYFWWRNTQGMHESSDDALRIMAGHDRHGGRPARLVRAHAAAARRRSSPPAPTLRAPPVLRRSARLAARARGWPAITADGDAGRPRPLVPGDERRGDAGAGLPRDRAPEGRRTCARRRS